jgi:hypothetical protein
MPWEAVASVVTAAGAAVVAVISGRYASRRAKASNAETHYGHEVADRGNVLKELEMVWARFDEERQTTAALKAQIEDYQTETRGRLDALETLVQDLAKYAAALIAHWGQRDEPLAPPEHIRDLIEPHIPKDKER